MTSLSLGFLNHCASNGLTADSFHKARGLPDRMHTASKTRRFQNGRRSCARSVGRRNRPRDPVAARVAIVGTVPDSFQNASLAPGFEPSDISLSVARSQHKQYCSAISTTSVSSLLQLPADSAHPDSVFVEDPVVMISGKTAFMARPAQPSRQGEGDAIEYNLKQLGVRISKHPEVNLDGRDVLKMNEFILVGITERTERAAIPALQQVVNEDFHHHSFYETCPTVIGIPVDSALHLKSLVTWVGPFGCDGDGFIVAADTRAGRDVISRISSNTPRDWDIVWIDEKEARAANVLYIPPLQADENGVGHVLVQEKCPGAVNGIRRSLEKYKSSLAKTTVIPVDTSELGKANGASTSMSVIV